MASVDTRPADISMPKFAVPPGPRSYNTMMYMMGSVMTFRKRGICSSSVLLTRNNASMPVLGFHWWQCRARCPIIFMASLAQ